MLLTPILRFHRWPSGATSASARPAQTKAQATVRAHNNKTITPTRVLRMASLFGPLGRVRNHSNMGRTLHPTHPTAALRAVSQGLHCRWRIISAASCFRTLPPQARSTLSSAVVVPCDCSISACRASTGCPGRVLSHHRRCREFAPSPDDDDDDDDGGDPRRRLPRKQVVELMT